MEARKTTTGDGAITDDFGIPERDEEYILCNDTIWEKIFGISQYRQKAKS